MNNDRRQRWARNLRFARTHHPDGITQAALAKASGVSQAVISQFEHNKAAPSDATKSALADALGYDPDLLFPLSDVPRCVHCRGTGHDDPELCYAKDGP